ncbi:GlxA family transcriptional regulator [Cognatishimia activa]|uniref:GlxA family transcriptional regulator n=1 Tax=Cognatishimia activa TaxID=1715691 RepID=UPI0022320B28|nr:GlxA family transcriptional regulator [Cognatishimia activa]UZD91280.1 GlxA family transcriptional regulator [Cognatishimia activa]
MPDINRPTQILMLVAPSFNISASMNFIDPLRAVNYLEGSGFFHWQFVSEAGGLCMASNGAEIATKALADVNITEADVVIVSTSWTPEDVSTPALLGAVRGAMRNGKHVYGLDTGAFVLAHAGVLEGKIATVHYEHMDAFIELFPEVTLSEDQYVFDGRIASCCGGTASVDFAVRMIRELHGPAIANAAARYIFHTEFRRSGTPQNPSHSEPLGVSVPEKLRRAIKIMEQHLEDPLSIPEICSQIDLSQRQLSRLFAKYLNKTPILYYRDIRLDRARGLVTQTTMAISEISVASGFASQVHFSRAYRERFDLSPLQDRGEGRIPFEFRAWPMHRRAKSKGGGE